MSASDRETAATEVYEPRHPTLGAAGFMSLWIAILSLPMWTGKFLAAPWSDQYATGFAFRHWAAQQWRTTGQVPLWNSEIFGGMPFVAAMHGDIFYPTAWLRLVLPTEIAMNAGFVIHYVIAGLFLYLLLRMLGVSWTGSVVGGLGYQLSGVVASYVNPGHDGKLFVTALLPLALIALVLAFRRNRLEGYPLLALAVGLGVLSPHPQLLYYMLVAAGIFALYLAFGEKQAIPWQNTALKLGGALGAVVVGFGVGMIQILPFYHYIPFSPRAEGYYGFEGSTSFAIPWQHVPEFFLSRFVGWGGIYWGTNPLKLHSEYLGLPLVALAVLGATGRRRRLVLWLSIICALFLLVSLGAGTPFYRVWWEVMPFMKQVRAPGMAFFLVAFVVSIFAALGVERLERGEGKKHVQIWLVVAGIIALLAVIGAFGAIAASLAQSYETQLGLARVGRAQAAQSSIRFGALVSAAALAILAGAFLGALRGKIKGTAFSLIIVGVVGIDLWWNARGFWNFSSAPQELYASDPITERLTAEARPFRVFNTGLYPGSALMKQPIAELFGHHGNELHAFDELMGGKLERKYQFNSNLWNLYAIQFVIASVEGLPGFRTALVDTASTGRAVVLLERIDRVPYARLIPAAVKVADSLAIPALLNRRFPVNRVVFVPRDADVGVDSLTALPESIDVTVNVAEWSPGHMRLRISPAAPQDGFVLVAENYYPDWRATIDGEPTAVVRGDVSLILVPISAGAREIELTFVSSEYKLGRLLSLASLGIIALGFGVPRAVRRRGVG